MANIGPFTFTQWRINMPRIYRPKVRLPARAGVQGNIIVRGSRRSEIAQGACAVLVGSRAAAQALIDQYYALCDVATVVSVTDQHGRVFPNVIALSVSHMLSDQVGGTARLDSVWSLDVGF
jgi:hypothetical protein